MKISISREALKNSNGNTSFKKDIRAGLKKYKGKLAVEQLVFFSLSQELRKETYNHDTYK